MRYPCPDSSARSAVSTVGDYCVAQSALGEIRDIAAVGYTRIPQHCIRATQSNALQYAHTVDTEGISNGTKRYGFASGGVLLFNINCAQIPGNCQYSQPDELPLVRRQPEYLIEAFEKNTGGQRYYYRITVRGYGMRTGTRVMLQEVYTP